MKTLILLLSLSLPFISLAGSFEEIKELRAEKNYEKAYQEALELYKKGAPGGAYYVGLAYHEGKGVETNYAKSLEWYLKASDHGHSASTMKIAELYWFGDGVKQSNEQSFKFLKKAATQSNPTAIRNMGELYLNGSDAFNVKQNHKKSALLFFKAVELGDIASQFYVGNAYHGGVGVPQNPQKALEHYLLCFDNKDNINRSVCAYNIGALYSDEKGLGVDDVEGTRWFRLSAEGGYKLGQKNLAESYYKGIGIDKNYALAAYWASQAEKNGQPSSSLFDLAKQHLEKYHVDQETGNVFSDSSRNTEIVAKLGYGTTVYSLGEEKEGWIKIVMDGAFGSGFMLKKLLRKATMPTATSSSAYPEAPPVIPGKVSCRTKCVNANCFRTYSDGRKLNFQATQKYDPMTQQFKWDSGSC